MSWTTPLNLKEALSDLENLNFQDIWPVDDDDEGYL